MDTRCRPASQTERCGVCVALDHDELVLRRSVVVHVELHLAGLERPERCTSRPCDLPFLQRDGDSLLGFGLRGRGACGGVRWFRGRCRDLRWCRRVGGATAAPAPDADGRQRRDCRKDSEGTYRVACKANDRQVSIFALLVLLGSSHQTQRPAMAERQQTVCRMALWGRRERDKVKPIGGR
jgi:hypothetical protein